MLGPPGEGVPMILNMEEQKRRALLSEIRRWIAEHGVEDLTMSKLADFCGVAKGTLYNYFPSKEELLAAVVEDALAPLDEEVDRVIASDHDPRQAIRELAQLGLRFFKENRDLLLLYAREVKMANCILPDEGTAHGRFMIRHMESFVGRFSGVLARLGIKDNLKLLAYLFHEMLGNFAAYNLMYGREVHLEEDAQVLTTLFLNGVEGLA